MAFVVELSRRLLAGEAPAVVGLDPRLSALPTSLLPDAPAPDRIAAFYQRVLPALARHVPVVKPNIAFFECFGSAGFAAYESTCATARKCGLLVLGDIKRAARKENHRLVVKRGQVARDNRAAFVREPARVAAE